MIINVIQEDIDNGKKGSCKNCPIALAVNRFFNYEIESFIGSSIMINWEKSYKITKNCQRFINDFDTGNLVHPFHFRLLEYKHV